MARTYMSPQRSNSYSGNRGGYGRKFPASSRGGFRGGGRKITYMNPALIVKRTAEEFVAEPNYVPQNSFAQLPVCDILKQNITKHGYTLLTPIQDQAILPILEGKDVVGIANTGTGKTAAFLIPLLHKIFLNKSERALIIVPTRELAVQILDECRSFVPGMGIFPILCIGGASMHVQIQGLRRNPNVVIGTPGRLKDLGNQRVINFANYQTIVLDEVDRMLDMGFINDIKLIVSKLPQPRQSLFFSATVPPQVLPIMQSFLKNPITISVKSRETVHNVDQDVIKLNGRLKTNVLHDLLTKPGFDKVLVFGRTKWGIEKLTKELIQRGISAVAMHGNKNQNQRQRALDEFKNNRVKVLLATDIVARGIDVPDVTHVINYELPQSYEDYVHRIGRTGRAGKRGMAITLVD